MIVNLAAPEWTLGKAWSDSRAVEYVKDAFHRAAEMDGVPWEKCHSHFANLGGFAISFSDTPRSDAMTDGVSLNEESLAPGLDHADPGIQLDQINRYQNERGQNESIHSLDSQPILDYSHDGDLHSLLETGDHVPMIASTTVTGLVAQPVAIRDQSLSPGLRKSLDKYKRAATLASFPRYHYKLSRAIGLLEFKPHAPNIISAMEALEGM